MPENVDQELRRLAADTDFPHRAAASGSLRFRRSGEVAQLLVVADDPHPCQMIDVLLALACDTRLWLNRVPMPSESVCASANYIGKLRAEGQHAQMTRSTLSSAEPASAVTAMRRVCGPVQFSVLGFPAPDIRVPLRPGGPDIWRYDGTDPVPAVPAPSAEAVQALYEVAEEPWASPLSGRVHAEPLGALPLDDLLGLLAHLPPPPDTARWRFLGLSTPTYWYRLMQPWVCLGILRHRENEPWATSARRQALVGLAFGVEDWTADAALFALVAEAYHNPQVRGEVRALVRERLDAAVSAPRLVTIEASLAQLMLITPGCTAIDRNAARAALKRAGERLSGWGRLRWWRRG